MAQGVKSHGTAWLGLGHVWRHGSLPAPPPSEMDMSLPSVFFLHYVFCIGLANSLQSPSGVGTYSDQFGRPWCLFACSTWALATCICVAFYHFTQWPANTGENSSQCKCYLHICFMVLHRQSCTGSLAKCLQYKGSSLATACRNGLKTELLIVGGNPSHHDRLIGKLPKAAAWCKKCVNAKRAGKRKCECPRMDDFLE